MLVVVGPWTVCVWVTVRNVVVTTVWLSVVVFVWVRVVGTEIVSGTETVWLTSTLTATVLPEMTVLDGRRTVLAGMWTVFPLTLTVSAGVDTKRWPFTVMIWPLSLSVRLRTAAL